ncbi:MAG: cobG [Devosia sp.]|nr:cobG [Devosia sp.]
MQTGDGLLARLRIRAGRLTPGQLQSLAELAQQHGNGLLEITARGNLQVRGLSTHSQGPFATAALDVVDVETGLAVETPPLAGDDPHEIADPDPLAKAIRKAARPLACQLGPKVTIVVDGCGQVSLAALKADIRLTAAAAEQWQVSIAGRPATSASAADALDLTMASLAQIAAMGPDARATDLPGQRPPPSSQTGTAPIGVFALRERAAVGLALPFGSMSAPALIGLSRAAARHSISEFRLAPHHGLIAIGAGPGFLASAAALGFMTSTGDPRTRISACIGNEGCASGHIPARTVAQALAEFLPAQAHLHVSGCSKGCAHPRRAAITLVGRPDGYGLVIGGMAGDTPGAVLQADQLESALRAR